MANTTEKDQSSSGGSLKDFNFDGDNNWFGVQDGEAQATTTIKESKKSPGAGDKGEDTTSIKEVKTDEDDVDPEEDNLDWFDQKPDNKTKKAPKLVEEDDEVVETKPTKKATKKVVEETEEEDDEEDTTKKPTKKAATKKEVEEIEEEEVDTTNNNKKTKDNEDEEEVDDEEFYGTLAHELKQKGVFNLVEVPKDKKLTEDEFFEHLNEEVEGRVEEALQGMMENLDEDAKRFLKFKKDGGDTHTFFSTVANTLDIKDFDEDNDAHVNKVLRYYVNNFEDVGEDEVDDRIKFIKEGGKAKATAVKWYNKIKETEDAEQEQLLAAQSKARKQRQESIKQFGQDLAEVFNSTESVGSFTFSKADQKRLHSLVTKATVKVGKDRYIPEFNAKLGKILSGKTEEDKKRFMVLAKLIDSDFDVKDIAIKKKTEVAREAKSSLKAAKAGVKAKTSNKYAKDRELSDYFDEER